MGQKYGRNSTRNESANKEIQKLIETSSQRGIRDYKRRLTRSRHREDKEEKKSGT